MEDRGQGKVSMRMCSLMDRLLVRSAQGREMLAAVTYIVYLLLRCSD